MFSEVYNVQTWAGEVALILIDNNLNNFYNSITPLCPNTIILAIKQNVVLKTECLEIQS